MMKGKLRRTLCWLLGYHHARLVRATTHRHGDWRLTFRCEHCGAERVEDVDNLIVALAERLGIREKDL